MSSMRPIRALLLAALLLIALPLQPAAHEVPPHVTVLTFIRPEGERLRILVRVPLQAMRDIEFPLRASGDLDIEGVRPLLAEASRIWIAGYLEFLEDDVPLGDEAIVATRISLPSDRSFERYEDALAHVRADPLPPATALPWEQALLDVLLEVPITSDQARFSVKPGLAHLGVRTVTILRFAPRNGAERVFRYEGNPGEVRLDPRWHQAFLGFVRLGFGHILEGIDHLLFVLCLVIPLRRVRPLVVVVTAFTVAHSLTLIAAASGLAPRALWFPPLIETLIALSIVWMALENIVLSARSHAPESPASPSLDRRWLVAFVFGLVHGFGFSFLLRDSLQFAGSHLITSLLAFNIGVELGQIVVILAAIPLLHLLFRHIVAERIGIILLSALIAHSAWHWFTGRGAELLAYEFSMPAPDVALLFALRALLIAVLAGGALWLLSTMKQKHTRPESRTTGSS